MFSNNSASVNPGYLTPGNGNSGFNECPLEVTSDQPPARAVQTSGFDFDATLAGLSMAEIEDWWLGPKPDGGAGQYTGSTLLDSPCNEFATPYNFQAGHISGTNGFDMSESHRSLIADRKHSVQC